MGFEKIDWEKHHEFMREDGRCGQTTIKVIFNACGIDKSVHTIGNYIWKKWYGSPYILVVAYLKLFFSLVNYKTGSTTSDISSHLKSGHICIINFQAGDECSHDGHYAIVSDYKDKTLTIVDTSADGDWQYTMTLDKLKKVWYDTLTCDGDLYHTGLLIWLDPKSKRIK